MAIDFNAWNEQFGGEEAVKALKEAAENGGGEFTELPDGNYLCKIEKLELGESKKGQPMIKGMFRIIGGSHKKQCLFYNQVFCRNASGNAFSIKKGLDFLRSLQIFDDSEVDFDGDYAKFIEEYTGKSYPVGDFVTTDGRFLGKHKGIIRYTIGQRRGMGISEPYC